MKRARWRAAWQALERAGLQREVDAATHIDDLLLISDVARRSGHSAASAAPLQRIVAAHADDPQAALASFSLGTLRLDTLDEPARAAHDLGRALALGLPKALREDAHARLVEAHARAGQAEAARSAAEVYYSRFPDGRRTADVKRWSERRD